MESVPVPDCSSSAITVVAALLLLAGCASESSDVAAPVADAGGLDAGGDAGPRPDAGPAPWPCGPGELELADGGCRAPGLAPSDCADGFVPTGEAGCAPVLPAEPCGPGTLAVPGDTTCRSVADCSVGPWGAAPIDASTEFVAAAYLGGDSDGSELKPWTTIQAGIDAASSGAVVAIAAGSYAEDLYVGKAVRLWGACPAEVEIVGQGVAGAAVQIWNGGGAELHDLAVTGPGIGVGLWASAEVGLHRVWIHDLGSAALYASEDDGASSATLADSLIELTTDKAVWVIGAQLTMQRSVVRDTQPLPQLTEGLGLSIGIHAPSLESSRVSVQGSLVERNRTYGIQAVGSELWIDATVVRDTSPRAADDQLGQGIDVRPDPLGLEASLALSRSLVEGHYLCGVAAVDASATISNTVVRAIEPQQSDGQGGTAVLLVGTGETLASRPAGTMHGCLVEACHGVAVAAVAAELTMDSTVVRDTGPDGTIGLARGIGVEAGVGTGLRAVGLVRGSLVERHLGYGIAAIGSDLEIATTWVRDIDPREDGFAGRAIGAEVDLPSGERAHLLVRRCLVERAHEVGVLVLGSDGHIESTIVRDIEPRVGDQRGGWGIGIQSSLSPFVPATATIDSSSVDNTYELGIAVIAAAVTIAHTWVRAPKPTPLEGILGDGLMASAFEPPVGELQPATMTLIASRIESSPRAGVSSFAAEVVIAGSTFECNGIDLDGELLQEHGFSFEDGGDNLCGCSGEPRPCQVQTTNLAAPDPL